MKLTLEQVEGLRPFATPAQSAYLDAILSHDSVREAARALGVHHSTVEKALARLLRNAARKDPAQHRAAAPPGYLLRGVSTLNDANGKLVQQWVKTSVDQEQQLELLKAALDDIVSVHAGRLDPIPAPSVTDESVLAVYPLPDLHIGLLSWAEETGADFDLKIAERVVSETVDRLVASAPPTKQALLINLGDFLHVDNASSRTERAGNALDSDSRYAKIVMAGFRIIRRIIDRLLQKHDEVLVWTLSGNHDPNTAVMLRAALGAIYEREPRIRVSTSPAPFQVMEFGASLIGAAHGDTAHPNKLPAFMAANWPVEWGRTTHRIWYTGHVHHDSSEEHPGCIVESLRTIAQRDAWHVSNAYHSGRDLKCDVWSRSDGRIARLIQRAVGG